MKEPDKLIGWPDIKMYVPFGLRQLARMEAAGQFPKRLKLGHRKIAWSLLEILRWIEARKDAR
jgi:prophage regulatory protein